MIDKLKDILILVLLTTVFFGINLGRYPISVPDGARYSEIPREMVLTGDYITPRLNGIKYFEKPPLFYWLQAGAIKLFGANELAVSIVNALMTIGTIILVYLAARYLYNRIAGLWSTLVYSTYALVFALTRVITLDAALTFFLTGMLVTFTISTTMPLGKNRKILLMLSYFFTGCAVMTKGLVGLIFPSILIVFWLTIAAEWRNLKNYYPIAGLAIFLVVTLPWHILVQLKNPEFFRFYFVEQHFLRYFTNYAHRVQKWWFFPTLLIVGLYPWIAFIPQVVVNGIKNFNTHQYSNSRQIILILAWIVIIYGFFSFSQSKLIPYILPIFPALAIITGNYISEIYQGKYPVGSNLGFYLLILLKFALALALVMMIFVLDFNNHVIIKKDLIITALIMLTGGILVLYFHRFKNPVLGLVTIVVITAGAWLYISPKISIINRQSIKPLILKLQEQIREGDEIVCYADYRQDLPFYMERLITVVDYLGELEFGTKHQDSSSWMINTENFINRWQSNRTIYMVVNENNYNILMNSNQSLVRGKVIGKLWNTLLVTNAESLD